MHWIAFVRLCELETQYHSVFQRCVQLGSLSVWARSFPLPDILRATRRKSMRRSPICHQLHTLGESAEPQIKTLRLQSCVSTFRRYERLINGKERILELYFRASRTSLHFCRAPLHLQLRLFLHHQNTAMKLGTSGPKCPQLFFDVLFISFLCISVCS